MTAAATPDIEALTFIHADRRFDIHYPGSPGMAASVRAVFESGEYPYLEWMAPRVRTIVDIGANVGCTAVLFRALYPQARIYAFEPCAETFAFLEANTAALGDVVLRQLGLFDRDAQPELQRSARHCMMNSLVTPNGGAFEVERITLRRASVALAEEGITQIDILKLDTEGAEVPILRDLEPMLDRIGAIHVEYHSERDRRAIEALLAEQFMLVGARVICAHIGSVTYAARALVEATPEQGGLALPRPIL